MQFTQALYTASKEVVKALKWVSPGVYAFMGVAVPAVVGGVSLTKRLWDEVFSRVDSLVWEYTGTADFSPLGIINTVFPLDTLCTYLVAYGVLTAACVVIRVIKSWIPTVGA